MATAKKSRGKAGSRAKKPMKKSRARVAKNAAPKKAAKRGPQRTAKKTEPKKVAQKKTANRAPAKKRAPASATTETANPLSRVARVAKEIAHQTTVAVTEGVDKVKEMGGTIVDRVTG